VLGGSAVALGLGLLDLATWGSLFHSMRAYLAFNLSPAVAHKFGAEPATFFLPVARDWLPWPLLLGVPWMAWRRDRMLLPAWLYALALTATAHKEPRFLFPVVLLVAVALAPACGEGLCALWSRGLRSRALAAVGLLAFVIGSAWAYRGLPDLESDLFRATMHAGADPRLDQLIVVNESRWGCGGSFYVGRDINVWYTGPGYPGFREAMATPAVNRAVVFRSPKDQAELERFGFHTLWRDGQTTLLGR
jgi:phosphatidylinositol glycan class B